MEWIPNKSHLVRGYDETPVFVILDIDGTPINPSGFSGMFLRVKNQDGSILEVATNGGFSAGLYKPIYFYSFLLTGAQTLNLPLGPSDVTLRLNWGTTGRNLFLNYPQAFTVSDPKI